jgi:hypothetical protein
MHSRRGMRYLVRRKWFKEKTLTWVSSSKNAGDFGVDPRSSLRQSTRMHWHGAAALDSEGATVIMGAQGRRGAPAGGAVRYSISRCRYQQQRIRATIIFNLHCLL